MATDLWQQLPTPYQAISSHNFPKKFKECFVTKHLTSFYINFATIHIMVTDFSSRHLCSFFFVLRFHVILSCIWSLSSPALSKLLAKNQPLARKPCGYISRKAFSYVEHIFSVKCNCIFCM